MRQLVWNDQLAEIAQRYYILDCLQLWACIQSNWIASHCLLQKLLYIFSCIRWVDQCDSAAHDKNRRVEKFQVGQNWAMLAGSYLENKAVGESGSDMIQDWYDEVSNVGRI